MIIKIVEYRGEISILEEICKGIKVKRKKAKNIKRKYMIKLIYKMPIIKETWKQKTNNKAQHISRYERLTKSF